MRIFLIGYMGCGKSRWGKMIAAHYGYQFIDLDTLIEELEGISIPEIFEQFKEKGFRKRERLALESIAELDNVVVATGGGAPCYYNNMEMMNDSGETIYIQGSPELLRTRITNSKTERPLVKNLSQEELFDYIKKNLKIRNPYYTQAKHTIVSGKLELKDFINLLEPIIKQTNQKH